jgi:hypothetical protein
MRLEHEAELKRQELALLKAASPVDCPPSPDDEIFMHTRDETKRAQSYSSVNSTSMASQMTSPSDMTSPISSVNLGSTEQFFPSVPSLPALISGASSVSADTEGDMLQQPGFVKHDTYTAGNTPETLTPPALSKHASIEDDTTDVSDDAVVVSPDEDEEGYNGDGDTTFTVDDDDSDSDEGLTMSRKKPKSKSSIEEKRNFKRLERRGTNGSVGSTETAKKVVMDS